MATNALSGNNAPTFVLMWLDPCVDNDENANAQKKLATIYTTFKKFKSVNHCEDAVKQLSETSRAILIVSGEFGKDLVPRIHELQQVLTIYVFCLKQEKHIEWARQYDKVNQSHYSLMPLNLTICLDQSGYC